MKTVIASKFKYHPETLFMAITIFDRYIALTKTTMPKQYYVIAITCIYISAKTLEENSEPKSIDFLDTTKYKISKNQIKSTEKKIMNILEWRLPYITPFIILHEVLNSLGFDDPRVAKRPDLKRKVIELRLYGLFMDVLGDVNVCYLPASYVVHTCVLFLDRTEGLGVQLDCITRLLPIEQVRIFN
jgi:hypothetical protein